MLRYLVEATRHHRVGITTITNTDNLPRPTLYEAHGLGLSCLQATLGYAFVCMENPKYAGSDGGFAIGSVLSCGRALCGEG